jgi:hypothetical protein
VVGKINMNEEKFSLIYPGSYWTRVVVLLGQFPLRQEFFTFTMVKQTGEDYAHFQLDIKLGYIGNFSSTLVSLNAHWMKLQQLLPAR